jgi:hypothetical protein
MLMIAVITILVGIFTWEAFIAVFVQKTNAVYEDCNSSGSNNDNITCTDLRQNYNGIKLAYLFKGNTDPKLNHNDTATRNMNIHPYNNMPFLLPFP